MNCFKVASLVAVFSLSALAQSNTNTKPATPPAAKKDAPGQVKQAAAPDMSKMGPWTRKPTDEGKTRKEITEWLGQEEELMKKGDFEACAARADYPVFMTTDDSAGVPVSKEYSREQYIAMMKPFFENAPKDLKTTHKPTITVLSDSLAAVTDDFSMNMGKQKMAGKNASIIVKRDGQWKWKTMTEAGWGSMNAGTGGSSDVK